MPSISLSFTSKFKYPGCFLGKILMNIIGIPDAAISFNFFAKSSEKASTFGIINTSNLAPPINSLFSLTLLFNILSSLTCV